MANSGRVQHAAQVVMRDSCDHNSREYTVVPDGIQEMCEECWDTSPWHKIPTYIEPIYREC